MCSQATALEAATVQVQGHPASAQRHPAAAIGRRERQDLVQGRCRAGHRTSTPQMIRPWRFALQVGSAMQTWVGPTSTAPLARQKFKEERSEGSLCRNRQNADPAQTPQASSCRTERCPDAAQARASNRTNVVAPGAHLPPTSTPKITRRQRHAWTSSGRGRRPCTRLPVTAARLQDTPTSSHLSARRAWKTSHSPLPQLRFAGLTLRPREQREEKTKIRRCCRYGVGVRWSIESVVTKDQRCTRQSVGCMGMRCRKSMHFAAGQQGYFVMIEPEYQRVLARYVSELPTGQPAPMMFCVGSIPLVKRLAFVCWFVATLLH